MTNEELQEMQSSKQLAEVCLRDYRSYKAIWYCLQHFNFEKVRGVMQHVGWKYFDGEPSVERLFYTATSNLIQAWKSLTKGEEKDTITVSSGGFEAIAYVDGDNIDFELKFVLEETSNN